MAKGARGARRKAGGGCAHRLARNSGRAAEKEDGVKPDMKRNGATAERAYPPEGAAGRSAGAGHVDEFQARGLLDPQSEFGGAPRAAISQIDRLFRDAERGGSPEMLKLELDRWGLFDRYQDRFLNLFRGNRRGR